MKIPKRITSKQLDSETGFGKSLSTNGRMMNQDGSFNVERDKSAAMDNLYHSMVVMKNRHFFLLIFTFYILLNAIFALIYCAIGTQHLMGTEPGPPWENFKQAFFFSTQTLTTVGYGHISPLGTLTNLAASLESFLGLLSFALISGLLYGRFSRPQAKIIFSDIMVVAPFQQGYALMFRMINARRSEMIETEVKVILVINQRDDDGNINKRYFPLALQIPKVSFFAVNWTVVHPITAESPIAGFTHQDLDDGAAEFWVLVNGTDEVNQQSLFTKHSYTAEEVIWNARFLPMIDRHPNGRVRAITKKVGHIERLEPVNQN